MSLSIEKLCANVSCHQIFPKVILCLNLFCFYHAQFSQFWLVSIATYTFSRETSLNKLSYIDLLCDTTFFYERIWTVEVFCQILSQYYTFIIIIIIKDSVRLSIRNMQTILHSRLRTWSPIMVIQIIRLKLAFYREWSSYVTYTEKRLFFFFPARQPE